MSERKASPVMKRSRGHTLEMQLYVFTLVSLNIGLHIGRENRTGINTGIHTQQDADWLGLSDTNYINDTLRSKAKWVNRQNAYILFI